MSSDEKYEKVNYFTFNHSNNTFIVCMEEGFSIYSITPFGKLSTHLTGGGIGYIEPIYNQRRYPDVYAVIAGGKTPMLPVDKALIYNAKTRRICMEISLPSAARAVRFTHNKMVMIAANRIYIHNFPGAELIDKININSNCAGLCGVTDSVVIYPGLQTGYIHITEIKSSASSPLVSRLSSTATTLTSMSATKMKQHLINAHNGPIATLSTNKDGTLIATASDKGTIIKIFDIKSGKKLKELRRGYDSCKIYNIEFSDNSKRLLCTSNHGTIHVFSIEDVIPNITPITSLTSSTSITEGKLSPLLNSSSPSLSPSLSPLLNSSSPTRLLALSKFSPPLFSLAALSSPSSSDRIESLKTPKEEIKELKDTKDVKDIKEDKDNKDIDNDDIGDIEDVDDDNDDVDNSDKDSFDYPTYGEEKRGGEKNRKLTYSPTRESKSKDSKDNKDNKDEKDEKDEDKCKNSKSLFSFAGNYINYFSSEWSFSQFHLPFKDYHKASFATGRDNLIYVISSTNQFYILEYDSSAKLKINTTETFS